MNVNERRCDTGFPPGMIAVPCQEWVWTKFMLALQQLVGPPGTVLWTADVGTTIASKRNRLVEQFLGEDSLQWLFCLDSDMVPPPETILQLLAARQDIVTAVYVNRADPYKIVCGTQHPESGHLEPLSKLGGEEPLKEVEYAGTACLLVRRRVFETLKDPWFEARADGTGSDIAFCDKARAHGFRIYCDTRLWVGHIGVFDYDIEFALAWQQSESERRKLKAACQVA